MGSQGAAAGALPGSPYRIAFTSPWLPVTHAPAPPDPQTRTLRPGDPQPQTRTPAAPDPETRSLRPGLRLGGEGQLALSDWVRVLPLSSRDGAVFDGHRPEQVRSPSLGPHTEIKALCSYFTTREFNSFIFFVWAGSGHL